MSKDLFVPRTVLLLGCLGMILPQVVLAEAPAAHWQAHKTMDIVLFHGGLLLGQVVNPQGHPKADAVVFIRQRDREVTQVRTDDQGRFAVRGLSGGAYELVTADTSRQIRAWSKITPPPAASQVALLIVAGTTVRGQIDALSDTYPAGPIDGTYPDVGATDYADDEVIFGDTHPTTYVGGDEPLYPETDESAYVRGAETTDAATNYYGNEHGHHHHRHTRGAGHNGGLRILGVRPLVWGSIAAVIAIPLALDGNDAS